MPTCRSLAAVFAAFAVASVTVHAQEPAMQTLDVNKVGERSGDEYGLWPNTWVTTPLTPVVIRQNHPTGPTYREALGYTFRLWGMKRPRLARMGDGSLALLATTWREASGSEKPVLLTSPNGRSWGDPADAPAHGTLVSLGGRELMIYGNTACFSKDGGATWDESVQVPPTDSRAVVTAPHATEAVTVTGTTADAQSWPATGHAELLM